MVDAFFQHFRAQDIGRHEVRRELDAPRVKAQHGAERIDELGLGKAGDAHQKTMPAGQDRDQDVFDHLVLAEDDIPDGGPGRRDPLERRLGGAGRMGIERKHGGIGSERHRIILGATWNEGHRGAGDRRPAPVERPVEARCKDRAFPNIQQRKRVRPIRLLSMRALVA